MGLHIKMLDTARWGEEKQTSTKAFQVLFDVVLLTNYKTPEYSQSSKSSWPSSKYKDRPVRKKLLEVESWLADI